MRLENAAEITSNDKNCVLRHIRFYFKLEIICQCSFGCDHSLKNLLGIDHTKSHNTLIASQTSFTIPLQVHEYLKAEDCSFEFLFQLQLTSSQLGGETLRR